jgi:hypothetical protein
MRYFLTALTMLVVQPAWGQKTTTFYDVHGNRTGSITREGSRDVQRDVNGNKRGYWDSHGVHRDKNGNRLGSEKTTTTR